jgi:ParB family transcriptional regulator, chromosome partitioning protein
MNAKKSALGRGLSALLQSAEEIDLQSDISLETNQIALIPVGSIQTNPFQPRTDFDENALKELSESIVKQGIIQPITVRLTDDRQFQLISGERRLRATQMAGLEKIPAYIRKANDQQMLEMALVENIQRQDLNAMEVAISFQRLVEECNITQEELSEKVGKNRSTITNYIRLLKLPFEIQAALRDNLISAGHARAIINIENTDEQLKLLQRILRDALSVRQVEALVRNIGQTPIGVSTKPQTTPELKKLAETVSRTLGSKVELKANNKGRGSIVIRFSGKKEMQELLAKLQHE